MTPLIFVTGKLSANKKEIRILKQTTVYDLDTDTETGCSVTDSHVGFIPERCCVNVPKRSHSNNTIRSIVSIYSLYRAAVEQNIAFVFGLFVYHQKARWQNRGGLTELETGPPVFSGPQISI